MVVTPFRTVGPRSVPRVAPSWGVWPVPLQGGAGTPHKVEDSHLSVDASSWPGCRRRVAKNQVNPGKSKTHIKPHTRGLARTQSRGHAGREQDERKCGSVSKRVSPDAVRREMPDLVPFHAAVGGGPALPTWPCTLASHLPTEHAQLNSSRVNPRRSDGPRHG